MVMIRRAIFYTPPTCIPVSCLLWDDFLPVPLFRILAIANERLQNTDKMARRLAL